MTVTLTDAQRQQVEDNLPLVYTISRSMARNRDEEEEFVQEGCLGLTLAVARFDPTRGFKFSTYAWAYIAGYIRKYRRRNRLIPLISEAQSALPKVYQLTESGYSIRDACSALGLSDYATQNIVECNQITSLDALMQDDSGQTTIDWHNRFPVSDDSDIWDNEIGEYFTQILDNYIFWVVPKHKDVVQSYYTSMLDGTERTQADLAREFGYTKTSLGKIIRLYTPEIRRWMQLWVYDSEEMEGA